MPEPFTLLYACQGNICRSPAAQLLTAHRLASLGWDLAEAKVTLTSAGLGTEPGWRIDPVVRELLERDGIPTPEGFRSQPVEAGLLTGAGLVLTATRAQRLRIGQVWPEVYARTFALGEAVSLLAGDPPPVLAGGLGARLAELARWLDDQRRTSGLGSDGAHDVPDPHGRRRAVYKRVHAQLDDLVGGLISAVGRPGEGS